MHFITCLARLLCFIDFALALTKNIASLHGSSQAEGRTSSNPNYNSTNFATASSPVSSGLFMHEPSSLASHISKLRGTGDYIASGLGLRKASTLEQSSVPSPTSSAKSSNPAVLYQLETTTTTTPAILPIDSSHNNGSSPVFVIPPAQSTLSSRTSRTFSPTMNASHTEEDMIRSTDGSTHIPWNGTGLVATNDTQIVGNCWAQWTSYWSHSATATGGEWISENELDTTFTTESTLRVSFMTSSSVVVTVTQTVIDNGHAITTVTSLSSSPTTVYSSYDVSVPSWVETDTVTSTIRPPSSSFVSANNTLTTPMCILPSIVSQCQKQWDTWASSYRNVSTSYCSGQYTFLDGEKDYFDLCPLGKRWGPLSTKSPPCNQASVSTDVCSRLRTDYTNTWKMLALLEDDHYQASMASIGYQPTQSIAPNGSVISSGYWPSTSRLAAGCTLGCGDCAITGGTVQLFYWPVTETSPPDASSIHAKREYKPITISTFNTSFIFVSPTAYVLYSKIYASDSCGPVGKTYYSTAIPIANTKELSSVWASLNTKQFILDEGMLAAGDLPSYKASFNFTDLNTPVPASIYDRQPWCVSWSTNEMAYQDPFDPGETSYSAINASCPQTRPYDPILIVPPQSLHAIDPLWSACTMDIRGAFDPPYPLSNAPAAAVPTPSNEMPAMPATPASSPLPNQPIQTVSTDPEVSVIPFSRARTPGNSEKASNSHSVSALLSGLPFTGTIDPSGKNIGPGSADLPSGKASPVVTLSARPSRVAPGPPKAGAGAGIGGKIGSLLASMPSVPAIPHSDASDPQSLASASSSTDASAPGGLDGALRPSPGKSIGDPTAFHSVGGNAQDPQSGDPDTGHGPRPLRTQADSDVASGFKSVINSRASSLNNARLGSVTAAMAVTSPVLDAGQSGSGLSGVYQGKDGGQVIKSDPVHFGAKNSESFPGQEPDASSMPGAASSLAFSQPADPKPTTAAMSTTLVPGAIFTAAGRAYVALQTDPPGQNGLVVIPSASSLITLSVGGTAATFGKQAVSAGTSGLIVGSNTHIYSAMDPASLEMAKTPSVGLTISGTSYTVFQTDVPGQSDDVVSPIDPSSLWLPHDGQTATLKGESIDTAAGGTVGGNRASSYDAFFTGDIAPFTVSGMGYTAFMYNEPGHKGKVILPLGSSFVTLSRGGLAITVDGKLMSAAANGLVVGSITKLFSPATAVADAPFTISGKLYTAFAKDDPEHIDEAVIPVGSVFITLTPGGSDVTLDGQIISAASNGLVVGSRTEPYQTVGGLPAPADPTDGPNELVASFAILGTGYKAFQTSALGHSDAVVIPLGSQTLTLFPGGSAATFDGQVLSATKGGLVVGSSTGASGTAMNSKSPIATGAGNPSNTGSTASSVGLGILPGLQSPSLAGKVEVSIRWLCFTIGWMMVLLFGILL